KAGCLSFKFFMKSVQRSGFELFFHFGAPIRSSFSKVPSLLNTGLKVQITRQLQGCLVYAALTAASSKIASEPKVLE
ncbi:MAG: hypothetical protein NTX25_10895, partial [Proteobacteria bacterium]|nr:hypothetical protein [Pseudomonadota bacterium]